MKTRKTAQNGERTFSKSGLMKANLEEYENDVLDQRLSQF